MKVKLLISRGGKGFDQSRGDVVDVTESDGIAMVKAGQAEVVTVKETASKKTKHQKAAK